MVFYWICLSKLGTKRNVAICNFKTKLAGGKFYELFWYDEKMQIIFCVRIEFVKPVICNSMQLFSKLISFYLPAIYSWGLHIQNLWNLLNMGITIIGHTLANESI